MKKPQVIDLGFGVARLDQNSGGTTLTIMTPGSCDEGFPYDPPQGIQIYQPGAKSEAIPEYLKVLAETILEYLKEES